ncbi:RNA-binding protein [Acinetobacter sp.]|uniref:RNA-binding protein n=1 Tax=Acinetobacter sp. TaxID=472 RepID=UPI0025834000|nr:RNA-binding protein [Acinetobacter sp.]
MANKTIFASKQQAKPKTIAYNEAGGRAYTLKSRAALAQLAATGTLNQTFYQNAQVQLDHILNLALEVDPEFVAKTAIYARQTAHMKDTPVVLLALLSELDAELFKRIFPLIIDNGKQLRNFVQIMRSGMIGRKSLGSLPKRMVNEWILSASAQQLIAANVGSSPSLADVLKMTHPKPKTAEQDAFFAYVLGKEYQLAQLPAQVQALEQFRLGVNTELPKVPMQLLTHLNLNQQQWAEIARNGSWQILRMNLNTFLRHDVFKIKGMTKIIADKLMDEQSILKSRVFPYQLMMTWSALDQEMPHEIANALKFAMQCSISNVPKLQGNVIIAIDVSGSMSSSITGYRQGATSQLRCVDVAALFASAFKYVNPNIRLIAFDTQVRHLSNLIRVQEYLKRKNLMKQQNLEIDIFALAKKFASMCGGGTDCSKPLELLVKEKAKVDMVIYFSDNESWADQIPRAHRQTGMMHYWKQLKQHNPDAKLVCVDLQPYATTQLPEHKDVMNIGGFSDTVFTLIESFANNEMHANHWISEIEKIDLTQIQSHVS